MAYETTEVPVSRSQEGIRSLLIQYQCSRFNFGEDTREDGITRVGFEFVRDGHLVRMIVPLKRQDGKALLEKAQRSRTKTFETIKAEATEQEAKRVWRVLFHSLKARLVAVENDLETFEEAFLPHLVDPATGGTVWQMVQERVESGALKIGGAGLLALPRAKS